MTEIIILPSEIKSYLEKLQDHCDNIKANYVLVDPSEVANFAKEEMIDKEISIFGLLPDVNSNSKNIDTYTFNNTIAIRVLEKTDYKSYQNQTEWMGVYERTAGVVKCIINKIKEDIIDSCCEDCEFLAKIDFDSLSISPVWREAGTNGWDIEFNLEL